MQIRISKTLDISDLSKELWAGAAELWADADEETRRAVWQRIEARFGDGIPDLTEVNDCVRFECDDLFFSLPLPAHKDN